MILRDFDLIWWVLGVYPRIVFDPSLGVQSAHWAGLWTFEVLVNFYVVKLGQAPESPHGTWGPKLWGTFIPPRTPYRYH